MMLNIPSALAYKPANAPQFSGFQAIQIHGDKSSFPDHMSFRWVPYLPADEVQIFNDTAWGDTTPGRNGAVIDHPTMTFKDNGVAVISAKMAKGVIPDKAEIKTVIQNVIMASGLPQAVQNKFLSVLARATPMVRLQHTSENGTRVYYDGEGNLKNDQYSVTAKAAQEWDPEQFGKYSKKFSFHSNHQDKVEISFESHPSILRWD